MSEKRFSIEELIEHCERQKKRMGAMCVNSSNILLLEHMDTAEYLKELKEYKDAEEQGLLLRPKLYLGQILYEYFSWKKEVVESRVSMITLKKDNTFKYRVSRDGGVSDFSECSIGKTVFLTREEAEAALAEMEKQHD